MVVVTQKQICPCEPAGAMPHIPNVERIHNNLQNVKFIPGATGKPSLQRLLDHAMVEDLEGDDLGVCPNIECGQPVRYFQS